jgi:hypothetical protein
MHKLKLLQENGFENSLKSDTAAGSKNLISASSVVWNERETVEE